MTRHTPMYVQDGSYAASQDRQLISALWPGPASYGCAVSVASAMTLNIGAGKVAVPTQNNTGSTLCNSDATEQVILPAAPPSGQSRIDLVICRPRDADLDGSANSDFIFDSVQGTPAATPTIPATPPGTVALAQVTVPGGAASIVAGDIIDVRPFGLSLTGSTGLPPPTTSATIVFFTDASGEIWCAKAGVDNGNWHRCRDVLHARVWRSAAFTIPISAAYFVPHDTIEQDPYGLWEAASSGYRIPIKGIWRAWCQTGGPQTVSDFINTMIRYNGTRMYTSQASQGSASGGTYVATGGERATGFNVLVQHETYKLGTAVAGNPGQNITFFEVNYVGTGFGF